MKFTAFAATALLALALMAGTSNAELPAGSQSAATHNQAAQISLYKLGRKKALSVARRALRTYYGNTWIYGFKRRLWVTKHLGRTRLRLAYVFNGRRKGGYITVWRSGVSRLSWYLSPLF